MNPAKDLVRRWIDDLINNNDPGAVDEVVGAEFVEHALAPFGQTAPGAVDGAIHTREVVEWLRTQFPDLQMTVDALIAEDDLVSARVTATGTNLGPINGVIPPTGKTFRAQQCHWFRIADNRIVEHWAVRDDLAAFAQLGVLGPGAS